MNPENKLSVKLIHCGNVSIANPDDREQKNIFYMPMGLFPMADRLKKENFDIEILHMDLEAGKDIRDILDFGTLDAVGFDVHWLNQALVVLDTAELIKSIDPGVFVFLGGFSASLFAEEIVTHFPQVDAVVRGDGEIPIVELCRALTREKGEEEQSLRSLDNVSNLVWRDRDNGCRVNDFSYVAASTDLEELDFAAVDLLRNWEYYRSASLFYTHYDPIMSSPVFYLEPGRGCEYACTFCGGNCEAQKRMNNRKTTVFRSVDSAVRTIKKAVTFGFGTFYTCMESQDSDQWYIRLFNRLKEENVRINYSYGCWRLPQKPLIDAADEACEQVLWEVSPETSNIELRKENKDIRLYYTNRQLEEFMDYVGAKENMKVQLCFGYYLASDTGETVMDTIRYIIQLLIRYHWFLEVEYANFSTDPGSLFFFFPEKYDLDITVQRFVDYIKNLKEYYQLKEGQPADMTLCRPRYITDKDDRRILGKIKMMNHLFFSFRKSVSHMLKKTGTPDIFMDILERADFSVTADNRLPSHLTRDMLIAVCEEKELLDEYLYNLIYFEWEKQKKKTQVSRPTTQLYMDFETPANLPDVFHGHRARTGHGEEKKLLLAGNKIQEEENFDL